MPEERIETRDIKLQSDLSYEEKPVQVLDVKDRVTRGRVIKLFRVLWNRQSERDATWEREDYLQVTYPSFYENGTSFKSRDEIFVRGEGCNTPSVSLHVNHEHCINISITMITHEHHTMITCHLLHILCD